MLGLAIVIDVIAIEDLIEDVARWSSIREIFEVFGVGPLASEFIEAAHDFGEGFGPRSEGCQSRVLLDRRVVGRGNW